MAQTIRRGGKGVRRAAAASGTKRKVTAARRQTGSVIDLILQHAHLSEELVVISIRIGKLDGDLVEAIDLGHRVGNALLDVLQHRLVREQVVLLEHHAAIASGSNEFVAI